ncbi:MAG: M48 family metallopeptidase [Thiotrichales bacterium]|nr:MAG: M48 family metallopeptidase [Thiotrichales bacterium]
MLPFLFTGSRSLAELPTLGDPTLDSISAREEEQLGLAYYRSLRASLPVIEDIQLNYYLESLAQKLVTQSDEAGREFTFFIIQSPVINAFALPAGYIGVHSGLFLDADNEAQLASVLAHEISHVTQRHIARMIDESGNSIAINIATLVAAILVGTQDSEMGQAVLTGGLAAAQQSSINFTRANEYEADRIGIGLLIEAGINPDGMVEFFEHLLDKSSGLQIEYIRTHPLDINRVTEAKNRIKDEHSTLPKNSEDFLFAKARLAVLTNNNNGLRKLIELNEHLEGVIAEYLRGIALIKLDHPQKAIAILEPLSQQHKHPWIKLALADAHYANNDRKKTLELLEQLNSLYPGYLPVTLAYAKALNTYRQPDKSIELLLRQLQSDQYAEIYRLLAQAYHLNGQTSAALEATGNQYAMQGYYELAMQQYGIALNHEDLSKTSKTRLETKKKELMEIVKQRNY